MSGKTGREEYEEKQWVEGVCWCACGELPSSQRRGLDGKKLNGQEIDTVTILPVERVRKEDRRGARGREETMDKVTWEETGGRQGSQHSGSWGQALGQYQLNKTHTN